MTLEITKPDNKKVTVTNHFKRSNTGCIFCKNVCGCKLVEFYDDIRDSESADFLRNQKICRGHEKKIIKLFREAKRKGELLAGLDYYRCLTYGTQLLIIKFSAADCKHVEDTKLLRKRLDIIYRDYEAECQRMENKEK